jgi:isoleucyl-tRNA synthetase
MNGIEQYTKQKEEEVRKSWEENATVKKVRDKQSKGNKTFYFMDGPPYATGHIHMGTGLNKIMKDCAIRSQRMQGKKIFDRPGFDTHGLPIENKVEKKLGFTTKKEIEEFGIEKFVKECKSFATEFVDTMGKEFDNLGDWMPYEDPYLTLTNEYIEAIWYAFKKADEKRLLYLGKYPVHVCPRCATAVAYNEIEYSKLSDTAIFVKLKIVGEENSYLLIWTTTPWTLPANTGVMVHPKYEYAYVKMSNGEKWVIAKEKVEGLMNAFEAGYSIEKIVEGKDLEGIKYEPLFSGVIKDESQKAQAYRVILSDRYVNLQEGSGLVHTAPGHGKEDFDAGTKASLPVISPVDIDGTFTKDVEKYVGKKARESNNEIISELEEKGLIPYKHSYSHDYPLCWRCESPLLMISTPQWFLKISEIRKQLMEQNENVLWVPPWMKDRMKNWLESLGDWPVSRDRYWGTPLPIWVCSCGERKVIGSIEELKKEASLDKEVELHRPYIDEIKIKCSECGKEMSRVKGVLDVWFDSGVSSWANLGFPQNKELFNEFWPADLNIEMTEQVRGWWNSQSILSMICFEKLPYKAVSVHGMVRDLGHKKMSKSKGNAVTPEEMIEKHNRDYLRYYLLSQSRGTDFNFDVNSVKDASKFFNTLTNSFNYAITYLKIDLNKKPVSNLSGEDKWILSKLEQLSNAVINDYNNYEFYKAIIKMEDFTNADFSRTYLQLVRARINSDSSEAVAETVSLIANVLLRLLAPVAPHLSDYLWFSLGGKDSVHLNDFVEINGYKNEVLENEFIFVQKVAQNALALRSETKMRKRWQLEKVFVESKTKIVDLKEVLGIMCNVLSVEEGTPNEDGFAVKEFDGNKIYLKTKVSEDLKASWDLSELTRSIQSERKTIGLTPKQIVSITIACDDVEFINKNKKLIEDKTSTLISKIVSISEVPQEKVFELAQRKAWFEIERK